jgi:hypothetical protein
MRLDEIGKIDKVSGKRETRKERKAGKKKERHTHMPKSAITMSLLGSFVRYRMFSGLHSKYQSELIPNAI